MKKYILGIITIALLLFAFYQYQNQEINIGSDTVTPIAGQTYTLAGSGISSSDTSFTLTSFTITQNSYEIQDSDMSETFYITLEPGSRTRQEIISCTTVAQSATDNTATISGCTRGLMPVTPYTASTSLQFAHSGGSIVIFSDPPQLFNQTTFKGNDETITGSWLFPTPLSNENAATKSYVDSLVNGGTVSNDRLIVAGSAGETVATSTLVYFNGTDQEWYKVDTDTVSTYEDKFIGLTQGNGTNGNAISDGILLKGRDTKMTGMTAGSIYYASTTAGAIGRATTSQPIGIAEDTNIFYFDPVVIDLVRGYADNTFTGTNTFATTTISYLSVTDINGAVSKLTASSSIQSFASTTEQTVFSVTVPSGSLSTTNAIRFKVYIQDLDETAGGQILTYRFKYGSTTIATSTISGNNYTNINGMIEGYLYANNSASSQFGLIKTFFTKNKTTMSDYGGDVTTTFAQELDTGTASENSATDKTLSLTIQTTGGVGTPTVTLAGYVVELIQ